MCDIGLVAYSGGVTGGVHRNRGKQCIGLVCARARFAPHSSYTCSMVASLYRACVVDVVMCSIADAWKKCYSSTIPAWYSCFRSAGICSTRCIVKFSNTLYN